MTDIHTHILPNVDHGAKNVDESLKMLKLEFSQGVRTVALTPHFYAQQDSMESFFSRRDCSANVLKEALKNETDVPEIVIGAEVAWMPNMSSWDDLRRFCYEDTDHVLIELPMTRWHDGVISELYSVSEMTGLTPVIAHLDRYIGIQKKRYIHELVTSGFPFQVSAEALLRFFGINSAMELVKAGGIIISDCHNTTDRAPNMGKAVDKVKKRINSDIVSEMEAAALGILNK